MPENAWLTIVIGVSGVVAIVAVGLITRLLRPPKPQPAYPGGAGSEETGGSRRSSGPARVSRRAWAMRSFGPWYHRRSVAANLERAFSRIDAVDPYLLPRRIGEALSETGLWSAQTAAPESSHRRTGLRPTGGWPFGPTSPNHDEDQPEDKDPS